MIRIGTAGWSVSAAPEDFAGPGSHLERYAARLSAVEINSSFYRPHRDATYARWAASVPAGFAFAVKVPRAMTHERRLVACGDLIDRFAGEVAGLGDRLGPLLVQMPPSLAFAADTAAAFFTALQDAVATPLVCEPRHPTWFTPQADAVLAERRIARVAADPALVPQAGEPGGWDGLAYVRLHGSPRVYHSDYGAAVLAGIGCRLGAFSRRGIPVWCIFDNTALGHAIHNALALAATSF